MLLRQSRFWVWTWSLFVVVCGSALCADPPKTAEPAGEQFASEVVVIESKNGSTVALQQPRVRMIGGQGFVGGVVLSKETSPNPVPAVGSRIWIATSDISRIIEFDRKAQFVATIATPDAGKEIAAIEALGGSVRRDDERSGRPVVYINLGGCQKLKDEDLKILASFPELRVLVLGGTATSDAGLKHVAGLKNLTELYLIGTDITDAGLKELVGLQKLEELRVGNTAITDAGLKELAKLKNLKMVGMLGTRVTEAGVKEFSEALPDMRHNWGQAGDGGGGQQSDPEFDVSVEHPAYTQRHPLVLFDEAHENFHTAGGRYKAFADLIANDGYQVTPNKDLLTDERLAGQDVLIIANASVGRAGRPGSDDSEATASAFSEAECESVRKWVEAGGALLLITDHEPYGSASADLGKQFGVEMSLRVTSDPANESRDGLLFARDKDQLGDHPILQGRDQSERVNRVLTFTGQSLKGPPESVALLKFSETAIEREGKNQEISAAGRAQGVALKYGRGRVVIMGEAAQLSAQVAGNEPMGMNVPGCDNRRMALNLMHWLTGLID